MGSLTGRSCEANNNLEILPDSETGSDYHKSEVIEEYTEALFTNKI